MKRRRESGRRKRKKEKGDRDKDHVMGVVGGGRGSPARDCKRLSQGGERRVTSNALVLQAGVQPFNECLILGSACIYVGGGDQWEG
jgi:hypothetical protein